MESIDGKKPLKMYHNRHVGHCTQEHHYHSTVYPGHISFIDLVDNKFLCVQVYEHIICYIYNI